MAAKNVTVIPATISQRTRKTTEARTRRRVAGYARVSTDSDEQYTSYEAQVDYYTQFIKNNPEWKPSPYPSVVCSPNLQSLKHRPSSLTKSCGTLWSTALPYTTMTAWCMR